MKAVIPAAGRGTRLLPLTRAVPKELLPLGRKPVLQHIVDELRQAGLEEIIIVTSDDKPATETQFAGEPDIRFVRQPQPLGLGHALLMAREIVGSESFAVALADAPLSGSRAHELVPALLRAHTTLNATAVIAAEEVLPEDIHRRGILVPAEDAAPGKAVRVRDMVEKPEPGAAPGRLASACRYVFTPALFDTLAGTPPDAGGEIQLTDAVRGLIHSGRAVYALPLENGQLRHDTGNFAGYLRAFAAFAQT